MKRFSVFVLLSVGCVATSIADPNILVYNNNTNHQLAVTAANQLSTQVTVANSGTFDGLITGGGWDVVFVDCPSTEDASSWTGLQSYIAGGGRAVMSFWNWSSRASLANSFGATSFTDHSWNGQTLFAHDAGFFTGVTMPNSDWHDHWSTDGVIFNAFTGTSLGGLTAGGSTTAFLGNSGRTIAMSVIDEAGDTWLNDGSGVQIWKNAFNAVQPVPEPATLAALGFGALAMLRRRKK